MAALVVVLAASLCSALALDSGPPSKADDRIIDGEPACRGQFRHHAQVVSDDRWTYGGSLIKPTAILTRGHHVAKYKTFTIRLGTILWEGDDSAFSVESIWGLVHPEFNAGNYNNDIAVILLNVEVPLGKSIWPVKLPSIYEVNQTFTGRRALISGFGKVNATGQVLQERLRYAEVTVISNELCKKYHKEEYVPDTKLCAGNNKTGFCQGDHGGALVIRTGGHYKQIGIASYVDGSCGKDIRGVHTRVTSYLHWIQRAAGDLNDWGDVEYSYWI